VEALGCTDPDPAHRFPPTGRLLGNRLADSYRLLSGKHGLGLALEIDVGGAADVDGDPLDRAAGKAVRRPSSATGDLQSFPT
jgi:hypothetical protein